MRELPKWAAYGMVAVVGGVGLAYAGYRGYRYFCPSKVVEAEKEHPVVVENGEARTQGQLKAQEKDLQVEKQIGDQPMEAPPPPPENDASQEMSPEYLDQSLEALACYLFFQDRTPEELQQAQVELGAMWPILLEYRDQVPLDHPMVKVA